MSSALRFDISWLDMDLGWKDMEGDLSRFVRDQSRRKALHDITTLQERRAWLPGNYRIFFREKNEDGLGQYSAAGRPGPICIM